MQDVDSISQLGDIDDAKSTSRIIDSNFPYASSDSWHRLPVVRFESILNLIQLMARLSASCKRKHAKIVKGSTPKLNGLRFGHQIIQNFVCLQECGMQ
ncbi:hypothetical protein LMG28138_02375 [Pararobbsia alpina]|uniref:Uncharacterized protein n=1 Tax=Pararobbsia alpina TaxID=621374 RepID=A0A6S7BGG8_9BURK|nr:hypothetical protein LMG28138_02375 [Pararobbsia alpina]